MHNIILRTLKKVSTHACIHTKFLMVFFIIIIFFKTQFGLTIFFLFYMKDSTKMYISQFSIGDRNVNITACTTLSNPMNTK